MKLVNFKRPVTSGWLVKEGRRLDAGPFLGGAVEARLLLEGLDVPKEPLHTLTKGHDGGIYNGPIFKRRYVDDPEYGVPFISSSSFLLADLSNLPLLSKKDARSRKLAYLELQEGMILISCSGTIGRMGYVRPEMAGMWSSQDVMKVVADPAKISPGYLYAFLSSKYGAPLVVSGTYGAIIQHIEPEHLVSIRIPRLNVEERAGVKMQESAESLSRSSDLLTSAVSLLVERTHLPNPSRAEWGGMEDDFGFDVSSRALHTMRAWNHSRRVKGLCDSIRAGKWSRLGDLIDPDWLRWRVMFKRHLVSPEHGIEVITQKALFQLFPEGNYVSRSYLFGLSPKYVVPDKTILIAKQGTLGENEVYCRCQFITGEVPLSRAYSDHCMRVVVKNTAIHPGYLYAFLRSDCAFRILRSLSEGAKQQDLHYRTVPEIPVPRTDAATEERIGEMVLEAYRLRNKGVAAENEARRIVEFAVESGV